MQFSEFYYPVVDLSKEVEALYQKLLPFAVYEAERNRRGVLDALNHLQSAKERLLEARMDR